MTTTTARKRYPGPKPFDPQDKDLFFGREKDAKALIQMLELRPTTTLHGQSGLGKSSLLNTRVLPHFEAKGYQLVRVRFNNYNGPDSPFPPSALASNLPESALTETFLDKVENEYPSIWQQCKNIQIHHRQTNQPFAGILLVFDQFEELFTYPEGADRVGRQLEKLLNDREPSVFRRKRNQLLRRNPQALSPDEIALLEEPLEIKILFSLRSDKMSFLNRISDTLPTILHYCYELHPFSREQAVQAISGPAELTGDQFAAPPFSYSPEALDTLLDFLTAGGTQTVDPFQIQLICPTIENRLIAEPPPTGDSGLPTIQQEALPPLEDLYTDYYLNSISALPENQQKAARLLIEDGLILPDVQRRISVDGRKLMQDFKIDLDVLLALVNSRLLKADQNHLEATSYELSHDSLVLPILQERKGRVEKENQRAYFRQIGFYSMAGLVLFILGFSIWVFTLNRKLTEINYQLLSAFNQLGWDLNEEQKLTDESVLDRTIDLTNEIASTRQALRDVKGKLENWQRQTKVLKDSLQRGLISQDHYIDRLAIYQRNLTNLLSAKEVNQMANSPEFLPVPDTSEAEIRRRIEVFYVEAARLEQEAKDFEQKGKTKEAREKYNTSLHKYHQIQYWVKELGWTDEEQRAQKAIDRIGEIMNPRQKVNVPVPVDADGDGIADNKDNCPDDAGIKELHGCPPEDSDGDGVFDHLDKCPDVPGTAEMNGCDNMDADRDQDGTPDVQDNCPDTAGPAELKGCPDTDGDGVTDDVDACRDLAGEASLNGCPDTDGDQIADQEDDCPKEAGLADFNGCPDTDGDGVPDSKDLCPKKPGKVEFQGCTESQEDPDPDKDNVLGEADQCPTEKGMAAFNGCPPTVAFPKVVTVQGGTFTRSDEQGRNKHQVTVNSFAIGATEITMREYLPFMLTKFGTVLDTSIAKKFTWPMAAVNWRKANEFCEWLSEQDPDHNYRLPTEAEWEYAARGGPNQSNAAFSGSNDASAVAYHKVDGLAGPFYSVGTKKPNALGIYDMSGGLAEWCSDWFDPNAYDSYKGQTLNNPKGPENSPNRERVLRGGHFDNFEAFCKIIDQNGDKPGKRNRRYGFRVVRY